MPKSKDPTINIAKRTLPNRAPKKGDRIEYQWDNEGLVYKKGKVKRGGKNTMLVDWDEDGLKKTVDVKGKEGWWFFESGNAKRKRKAWVPPKADEVSAAVDNAETPGFPKFMKSSTEGPAPKGEHKTVRFYPRQKFKIGGPTLVCLKRLGSLFTTHLRFTQKYKVKKLQKQHLCRLQELTLKKGTKHYAAPQKNVKLLLFWIKVIVDPDPMDEYGGKPTHISLIVCHWDKKLANKKK